MKLNGERVRKHAVGSARGVERREEQRRSRSAAEPEQSQQRSVARPLLVVVRPLFASAPRLHIVFRASVHACESDCQNVFVSSSRSCSTPFPCLALLRLHTASSPSSRSEGDRERPDAPDRAGSDDAAPLPSLPPAWLSSSGPAMAAYMASMVGPLNTTLAEVADPNGAGDEADWLREVSIVVGSVSVV